MFTYNNLPRRGHEFVDTMSTIIFSCLNVVRLLKYINVLHSIHQKVDTVSNMTCFGKGGVAGYISKFINMRKLIRDEYQNV